MRMRILLSLALLTALAFPSAAQAACSNPAGVEGEIVLNDNDNIPAYCDDTNWIAMGGGDLNANIYKANAVATANGQHTQTSTRFNLGATQQVTMSIWYRKDSIDGSNDWLFDTYDDNTDGDTWGQKHDMYVGGGGNIYVRFRNNSATNPAATIFSRNFGVVTTGRWHHLLLSIDWAAGTATGALNGNVFTQSASLGAFPDTTIAQFSVGGAGSSHDFNDGGVADFWMDWGTYLDFTVEANRRKFVDANRNPVNLGANGSIPTGSQPDFFFSGDTVDWHTNKGTVPAFSEVGTLTDYTPVPYINTTQIVPTGLVGHWRFDETSGTTAYDSSATGVDLTYSGSLNPAAHSFYGKAGRAIDAYYNGTYRGSVGSSSVPLSIKQSDQITMAAWVKIAADNTGVEGVIRLPGLVEWNIKFSDIRFLFEPKGWTTSQIAWGPTIPLDEWTHIAVSYDYNLAPNTTPVWFVNGVQRPSYGWVTSTPTGPFNPTSNTDIGIATSNYPGAIDDVRIYDRILNEDEVRQIYNARDGIRYNESMRKYEYFDGNRFVSLTPDWKEVDEGLSYDCPNIGDVCSDGSLYAGNVSNGDRIYVTSTNLTQRTWKSSAGVDDISTDSSSDGRVNVANLNSAITNFPAINECDTSTLHGQNDWYLPASGELVILNNNRAAIDANATNAFNGASAYWSSTESPTTTNAYRRYFDATTTNQIAKTNTHQVRCIRRAPIEVTGSGGLIGHWKMDETSGTTIADSSGEGNSGTFSSSLHTSIAAITANAPQATGFDFKHQRVGFSVPYDASLNTTNITIAAWVQFNLDNTVNRIVTRSNDYQLEVRPTNGTIFLKLDGGANTSLTYPGTFVEGRWYHIAGTFDDATDTIEIFVDGVSLGTTTNTESYGQTTSNLQIAENGPRSAGGIDDLRIYNRVLSAAEITDIYNIGSPIGSSTALPQGCPNIGDVCDDGTYYTGLSPDGNIPMYAAAEDESVAQWRSYGTSRATNGTDGDGNTTLLYSFGQVAHPHAYNCFDKVAHGASDWYWPASDELNNLYNGGNPVGGVIADGTEYWSSSQADANSARSVRFNNGSSSNTGKNGNFRTRCVRKGPAPRCANPYGLEGQMIYNSTHDIVQYCDGARWIAVGK